MSEEKEVATGVGAAGSGAPATQEGERETAAMLLEYLEKSWETESRLAAERVSFVKWVTTLAGGSAALVVNSKFLWEEAATRKAASEALGMLLLSVACGAAGGFVAAENGERWRKWTETWLFFHSRPKLANVRESAPALGDAVEELKKVASVHRVPGTGIGAFLFNSCHFMSLWFFVMAIGRLYLAMRP
jgi:hypothetical protein